jgi:hypothetical protein
MRSATAGPIDFISPTIPGFKPGGAVDAHKNRRCGRRGPAIALYSLKRNASRRNVNNTQNFNYKRFLLSTTLPLLLLPLLIILPLQIRTPVDPSSIYYLAPGTAGFLGILIYGIRGGHYGYWLGAGLLSSFLTCLFLPVVLWIYLLVRMGPLSNGADEDLIGTLLATYLITFLYEIIHLVLGSTAGIALGFIVTWIVRRVR